MIKYASKQIDSMKKAVISSGFDLDELIVYKCESCNTIVCTRPLSDPILNKGSQVFKLLSLDHIRTCDKPNIIVYGASEEYVNLSESLITKIQSKVGMYDKTYEQVLERSIYNSARILTKDEYDKYVYAELQTILDEVSEREQIEKIGVI